jgi:flagellar biosynthetic protein FliQ
MDVLREGVGVAIKLGGPLLVLSMLVGVIVAIFQAVTQIHEQTISFILKLIVVLAVLLGGGGWMLSTLQDYMRELFRIIAG